MEAELRLNAALEFVTDDGAPYVFAAAVQPLAWSRTRAGRPARDAEPVRWHVRRVWCVQAEPDESTPLARAKAREIEAPGFVAHAVMRAIHDNHDAPAEIRRLLIEGGDL